MLLGIQYFVISPSRRLTTHIWDIRETNLASCAIYRPRHFNYLNLYSQQTDTQHKIVSRCTYLKLFELLEYHNRDLCSDISFTFCASTLSRKCRHFTLPYWSLNLQSKSITSARYCERFLFSQLGARDYSECAIKLL